MLRRTYPSSRCPICGARIIVWKRGKVPASLLRALAVSDHVRTLHPAALASEAPVSRWAQRRPAP